MPTINHQLPAHLNVQVTVPDPITVDGVTATASLRFGEPRNTMPILGWAVIAAALIIALAIIFSDGCGGGASSSTTTTMVTPPIVTPTTPTPAPTPINPPVVIKADSTTQAKLDSITRTVVRTEERLSGKAKPSSKPSAKKATTSTSSILQRIEEKVDRNWGGIQTIQVDVTQLRGELRVAVNDLKQAISSSEISATELQKKIAEVDRLKAALKAAQKDNNGEEQNY